MTDRITAGQAHNPAPDSRAGRATARARALLAPRIGAWLPDRLTRARPSLTRGGAFDIGSPGFREACAILEDGTLCFVKAYHTGGIAAELADLRKRYDLPPEAARRAVSLAEMTALYGGGARSAVVQSPTPGQRRLQRVLGEAAALGASDIKLIEHATHGVLRIKVGAGEFTHGAEWQPGEVREAINFVYSKRDGGDGQANLVENVPAGFSIGQSGHFPGKPASVGAFRGQIAWQGDVQRFLNLRLLPKASTRSYGDLAALGLEEDILEALAAERRSDSGLVILGGSTGDGKSTTLVRHLERLYEERDGTISIYTIEDPIEYPAVGAGMVQFPVTPGTTPEERSANFSRALMVFVRTNPDVGMVSEIRSAADVGEVLHFVTSGHKVYTTVHANSANGVLFRLIALGVRPSELAGPDVVNLVLRQKLVPTLCPHCATPLTGPAHARVRDWLGAEGDAVESLRLLRRNTAGCAQCLAPYAHLTGAPGQTAKAAWAGYAGRQATAEFIRLDDTYRRYVETQDQIGALAYWTTPASAGGLGGIAVETRLKRLVARGVTDFEHVTKETLPAAPVALMRPKGPVPTKAGQTEKTDPARTDTETGRNSGARL